MSAVAMTGIERAAVDETLRTLTSRLLAARTPEGHWEGYLASSALATATAVGALALADPRRHADVVRDGIAWLAAHQNADGGWGDTTQSASNISTTALVWAACAIAAPACASASATSASATTVPAPPTAGTGGALPGASSDLISHDRDGHGPADEDLAARPANATRRAEAWLRDAVGVRPMAADGSPERVAAGPAAETARDAAAAVRPDDTLSAEAIVAALARRYGNDRTFSVPILTVLAIAGKLGDGAEAWRRVPQLPFELAACPHQWFQWLRLPVVSYALPALIAIGQVRHHHRPTRNPVARLARGVTRAGTLRTLRAIQPASGGYLEAVPLTAFVVMSLVSSSHAGHPVVQHGVRFLLDVRRDDGSWPIDSNLATWVTTLSVNALAQQQDVLEARDRERLIGWLLAQQHRVEHPYTHAAPGGWAWTDLPGGVPDADDTPGALLALSHLSSATRHAPKDVAGGAQEGAGSELQSWAVAGDVDLTRRSASAVDGPADGARPSGSVKDRARWSDVSPPSTAASVRKSAALGVRWLVDLQNRDGGIPTFCRGWGALPFDRSSPDLTAHALLAWQVWRRAPRAAAAGDVQARGQRERVERAMDRAVSFLIRVQRPDGAWIPLWFGNERVPREENPTYGTARVLIALAQLVADRPAVGAAAARGLAWLLAAQNADGGWGGAAGTPSSIEETALAVDALATCVARGSERDLDDVRAALARGVGWLVEATHRGTRTPASPIGLYFARLWYDERLYPLIFAVSALGRARAALDRPAR